MLSPEVWNFESPHFSVSTNICESEEELFRRIKHQYFYHHISITLPNTVQIPNDLINMLLEDSQYYRINKVQVAEFLKKDFLDLFIKRGQLTAISLHDCSNQNSLVITPCGVLVMSLSQSSVQELGIQDTFTVNPKSSLKKYCVSLNLISDSKELGKKYERMQKKLALHSNLSFDMILAWQSEVQNVCPSSVAYYFTERGYLVKTCDILFQQKLKYNVVAPIFNDETDMTDLIEWLGTFSLECVMFNDNFISSLKCPEENEVLDQVIHLSFTGLFTQSRMQRVISEINKYIKAKSSLTWISLSVQSFQDNILSVKNKHLFLSDGDQNYTIFFKLKHPLLIYTFQSRV